MSSTTKKGGSSSKRAKLTPAVNTRAIHCLKCEEHYLQSSLVKCGNCLKVFPSDLPLRRLPRIIDVLCCMVVYKQENKNVVQETINILTKHWISHNVYSKAKSNVRKMVDELWRVL